LLSYRTVSARVPLGLLTVAIMSLSVITDGQVALATPRADARGTGALRAESHWAWCNGETVSSAPAVVWARIKGATDTHRDIPAKYWSDLTYRDDIAKIVCYESTWGYHAENGGQYGWFQMSSPLIATEGVHFSQYWAGSRSEGAGWFQCIAGERYIHSRYGTPIAAWAHEENYGWY